jgi:ArsR family transcriptional regulator
MKTTEEPTTGPVASRATSGPADALASGFAALGESKRLRILAALGSGERCACDLTGCCGDRQPLLSFHLKRLREAGLVKARREGRWMHYSLERTALRALGEAALALAEGQGDLEEPPCC